jgi:hypothetical protein
MASCTSEQAFPVPTTIERKRQTDRMVDGVAGFRRFSSGQPSAGREFGNSGYGTIGQARQLESSNSGYSRKRPSRVQSVNVYSQALARALLGSAPRDRLLRFQVQADEPNKKPGMSARPPDKRFVDWDCVGLRTRAPKSSRKVSAVLARVDAEVPSKRSKEARSTSPVSIWGCLRVASMEKLRPLNSVMKFVNSLFGRVVIALILGLKRDDDGQKGVVGRSGNLLRHRYPRGTSSANRLDSLPSSLPPAVDFIFG